jgi:hypothetical protein
MGVMSDLVIGQRGYLVAVQKVTNISRDEQDNIFAWRVGTTLAVFKTIAEFEQWVDKHASVLDRSCIAVSGSASTLAYCQAYLKRALEVAYNGIKA